MEFAIPNSTRLANSQGFPVTIPRRTVHARHLNSGQAINIQLLGGLDHWSNEHDYVRKYAGFGSGFNKAQRQLIALSLANITLR